ncbi:hypothetical protein BH10PSE13_BH10PSE13_19410 [soil metagenome]
MTIRPSREENRRETVRRIQVGGAGVGGVLLLVGLTNVLVDNIRKDSVLSAGAVAFGTAAQSNVSAPSSEPLADLGVTPASDRRSEQAPAVPDLEPDPRLQKPMDRDPRQGR